MANHGHRGGILRTLRRLPVGTPVRIRYGDCGSATTRFQFLCGDEAAFAGGTLGATRRIKLASLQALRVGAAAADGPPGDLADDGSGGGPPAGGYGSHGSGGGVAGVRQTGFGGAPGRGGGGFGGPASYGPAYGGAHGPAPMRILRQLSPGTPVGIWFGDSGFLETTFQFRTDDAAVFSGGALDGGLTYVRAADIRAVRTTILP